MDQRPSQPQRKSFNERLGNVLPIVIFGAMIVAGILWAAFGLDGDGTMNMDGMPTATTVTNSAGDDESTPPVQTPTPNDDGMGGMDM